MIGSRGPAAACAASARRASNNLEIPWAAALSSSGPGEFQIFAAMSNASTMSRIAENIFIVIFPFVFDYHHPCVPVSSDAYRFHAIEQADCGQWVALLPLFERIEAPLCDAGWTFAASQRKRRSLSGSSAHVRP